jgi:hypothetical protein
MADSENAPDTPAEDDKALLAEAKERYKLASDWWADNRKAWLEDAKFRQGDQWPDKIKKLREDSNRPCVVVDKLNQYVRQVVNDGRQNRPGVKVRPEGDGAHADVAEVYEDLVRGICARSSADEAFDTALDHSTGNGYGFFRVIAEYAHPGGFKQELRVLRVRNPRTIILDPYFQFADASDIRFGFVEEDVPKEEYRRQYPKAKFTDWVSDSNRYGEGWLSDKSVRVCEYWYRVETTELVHLLADSTEMTDEDYQVAITNKVRDMPEVVDSRELKTYKVKFCRMSGAEILEKKDWYSQYIPLFLVIGNESDIDGKVTYSGLIRAAKDPQRLYNYSRSAYAERVALTPKAPFIAAVGQVEHDLESWENANTENLSVLTYEPVSVDGTVLSAPQRQSAADIPEGFARDMQLSEHDIQGSMGMYNASLGEKSNEKSGRAIMARQREGDVGTFHYPDNLNRAIRHMGRVIVEAAPKIYDATQVLHLVGEDGTASTAKIEPAQEQAVEELAGEKIFNLSIGRYGVDISTGPSYTTKRQEAVEAMMQLTQSAPEIMQVAGDIIVRTMDFPMAEELADRLKMALPPPIAQQIDAEEQGQDPKILAATAPLKQALDQSQQQIQAAEQGIAERDQALQKAQSELAQLKADRDAAQMKAQTDQYNAETARMKAASEASQQPEDAVGIRQMELTHEAQVEAARLDFERWKVIEDNKTKIAVAEISAATTLQSAQLASANAAATDGQIKDAPAPGV